MDDLYCIVAIAPDGEVVDINEVPEDHLEDIHIHGAMPAGGYITCLAVSQMLH